MAASELPQKDRMQICFDSNEKLKPGVNQKAITRPNANHYVRFTVPNPNDDYTDETLEISHRLFFRIAPLTPPKVPPLYESHFYRHWGVSVPVCWFNGKWNWAAGLKHKVAASCREDAVLVRSAR